MLTVFLSAGTGVIIFLVVLAVVLGIGGYFLGSYLQRKANEQKNEQLGHTADKLIAEAKAQSEQILAKAEAQEAKAEAAAAKQRELINEERAKAQEEAVKSLKENEKEINEKKAAAQLEIKESKAELIEQEKKNSAREDRLNTRSDNLDKREDSLNEKEQQIETKKVSIDEQYSKAEALVAQQTQKLSEIANMSEDDARAVIINRTEEKMTDEIARIIKEKNDEADATAKKYSQSILANTIQQYAGDIISERTVSTVALPSDELKGRIIGREGRNIRAIEAACGVDIIIDDTPDSVTVSCFDPIRREVARRVLETLVQDGRIQPSRVEDLVAKYNKELDNEIREAGEKAVFETGIGRVNGELVSILGRLKFRTSYGQNALDHSLEVAFLTGKMAAEIGEDEILARRAGLFHDIGKASDSEMEGSHVEIGIQIAERYKEDPTVVDAIASHHGDVEAKTIIAHLVAAADTLSAARPGARSESLENYIKRLTALEDICNSFKGVDKSYALQAGREIRIMVKPEQVSDGEAVKLSQDIREKIETSLQYPGNIKVIVIRETRAQAIAR